MPDAPTPPAGYRARPARLEDAADLSALFAAVDAAEGLEEVLGPEGTRRELTHPGLDRRRDTLVVLDPDGAARGFAWVWSQPGPAAARAFVWIEADPEHLHLEPFLLAWVEAVARPVLATAGGSARRYLRQHIEEHRERRRRAVEEAGYRHLRTFLEMYRALTDDQPTGRPLPPGIAVVPWSSRWEEAARLASNETFASHWDSLPVGPEDWQARVSGDPNFRPDLSCLAVRGDRVLSLCLAEVDAEQNDRRGVTEMWLNRIGTIPAGRRHGLATAVVAAALRAGATAGFTRAALGVDQDGTTHATALYERLGFTTTRRTLAYIKDLN